MFVRRLAVLAAASAFSLVAISACTSTDPCENVTCGAGLACDSESGTCKPTGSGGTCAQACSGSTPICDASSGLCKACTPTQGCTALNPVCDTSFPDGRCVQCTQNSHCPSSQPVCDFSARMCTTASGGGGGAGGGVGGGAGGGAGGGGGGGGAPDAGPCGGACSGATPVCNEDAGTCVECLQARHCPGWNRSCNNSLKCELLPSAFRPDGGACVNNTFAPTCNPGCGEGFTCNNGVCELNGKAGQLQFTVKWDTPEDIDLHVDEPRAGGGVCEIYYGDPNEAPDAGTGNQSSCGAVGWLDLDSNAGCSIDNIDIENIIYPGSVAPPSGQYEVRVDYYQHCSVPGPIAYQVTVRVGTSETHYCDAFMPADADMGDQGAGRVITKVTVP